MKAWNWIVEGYCAMFDGVFLLEHVAGWFLAGYMWMLMQVLVLKYSYRAGYEEAITQGYVEADMDKVATQAWDAAVRLHPWLEEEEE